MFLGKDTLLIASPDSALDLKWKDMGCCTPAYPDFEALVKPYPKDKQPVSPRHGKYTATISLYDQSIYTFSAYTKRNSDDRV